MVDGHEAMVVEGHDGSRRSHFLRIGACCALTAVLALLPGATASAGYADRIAADGPVAFWRLGDAPGTPTAADQTANGNTGTFAGGATLGQPGGLPGDPDTAVRFDGVDDSISVPDSNSLDATTGVTVEAWVKRTKKAVQVIVGKPGNGTLKLQNYALWLTNANNARAHFGSGTAVVTVVGSTVVNTEWHHLVATYDNATARVYVDGVLDGTKTSTVRMAANTQPLSVGREAATAASFFGGTLDEVAVYNKVLTPAEIQAHFLAADITPPAVTLTTPAAGSITNSQTPGYSGAAGTAAGDSTTVTVKVYAGTSATGLPVQTLTTTRSGAAWSASSLVPLIDGTYTTQAEQADASGNVGTSAARTFTVDTATPSVTLTDPAQGAATADATPALSGAAGTATGDGQTVTARIYSGSSATGTPVRTLSATNNVGTWSTSPATDLPDGTYTAQATQPDAAGNTGTSAAHTFTIDTSAPAVTVTDPADSSSTNDSTPTLAGAAGAASGDGQTITVRVYAGTTATGAPVETIATNRSGGGWTTPAATLADGTYTVQASQSDAAGNTGTSAARTFSIDTGAPTLTLTEPADGATTNDPTPALSGTAGTAAGDGQTITVRIYAGTTVTGTPVQAITTIRSGGTWDAAAATLADGTYTAQASQSDAAGNTGTSAAHTFNLDGGAPAVTLTDPADGSSTNDSTPGLAGGAGTASGDGQTITVRIYAGTAATGTPVETIATSRSGAAWTATAAALADGTYTAEASQSDDAGNTGTSVAHTFSVDTAAPAVTLTDPADGATTNDTTPALSGAAGATAGDGSIVTVRVYAGSTATGTPVETLSTDRTGATWTATAATLSDGTYTARATQNDAAGNTGTSAAHTFTIDTFVPDTTPPSVTLISPADGSSSTDRTPALSGAAGTDAGDNDAITVRIYAGTTIAGTPVQTLTTDRTGATWTATATALADGTYTARASQSDAAGNTGASAAHTFSVDTAAPAVTLTDPAQGATTGDATPALAGAAGTETGDAGSVTVRVYAGSSTTGFLLRTLTASASADSWSTDALPALGDGTYTAQASQSDAAGNTGTSTPHTFSVDTGAPAVTLTDPADGSSTNDSTPALGGAAGAAAGDGTTVTVRIFAGTTAAGTPVETLSTDRVGAAWTATASTLADGTYTAQASQNDAAGNTGTSAAHSFTIDTSGPAVTLTAPADGATTNDATPALAGAAGTASGDGQTITVRIYAGTTATGTPVQTDTTDRVGAAWTATASTLADGTYTARASQTDAAGNTGASAAHTFTIDTFVPDTTPPTVTLAEPTDGATSNDTTPALSGAAGTDPGDGSTVTVRVYAGTSATGAPVQTITTSRSGSAWSTTASSLADGTYTARHPRATPPATPAPARRTRSASTPPRRRSR